MPIQEHPNEDERYRRRVFWAGFFPITCVVIFCVGFAVLGTNVTRLQYDAALGKWRSQNITEYEATVSDMSMVWAGDYKLRVRDGQLVSLSKLRSGAVITVTNGTLSGLSPNFMTVEGMFEEADRLTSSSALDLQMSCWVDFDDALGYPSDISCQPKPWYDVTDVSGGTQIT